MGTSSSSASSSNLRAGVIQTTPVTADEAVLQLASAQAQMPAAPPRMRALDTPAGPRGKKRTWEEMECHATEESDTPRFKRARAETKAEADRYALFEAVSNGNSERVVEMITESPELLEARLPGPAGTTLLCRAVARGQRDIVHLLLDLEVKVDGRNDKGHTPLMLAAWNGQVDLISLLCERGADVNAYEPNGYLFPLKFGILIKNLQACQTLISLGADINRYFPTTKPGDFKISTMQWIFSSDYVELMIWLLDTGRITPDWIDHSAKISLINAAAGRGAASIVRLLLERGTRYDLAHFDERNEYKGTAIEIADRYWHFHVVECILRFHGLNNHQPLGSKGLQKPPAVDLHSHQSLWMQPKPNAADGLKDPQTRERPWGVLEALASIDFNSQNVSGFVGELKGRDWSALFAPSSETFKLYCTNASVLCANAFKRPWEQKKSEFSVCPAQQLQVLVEWMSDACSQHAPFSGLRLTRETEQVMNQMFDLQRELMLTAVAHLRANFEQHVQSLPELCMSVYISRTDQLNEPDLYRKVTEEWGLYDPVARAALRLVKDAYGKLQRVDPQRLPPKFAALSPGEQLGHVMAQLLDEWDKVPEIVEALRKGKADKDVEFLQELLFQQWRLFGEAFGVRKPHYSPFNPRRPERAEAELQMEVDVEEGEEKQLREVPVRLRTTEPALKS